MITVEELKRHISELENAIQLPEDPISDEGLKNVQIRLAVLRAHYMVVCDILERATDIVEHMRGRRDLTASSPSEIRIEQTADDLYYDPDPWGDNERLRRAKEHDPMLWDEDVHHYGKPIQE